MPVTRNNRHRDCTIWKVGSGRRLGHPRKRRASITITHAARSGCAITSTPLSHQSPRHGVPSTIPETRRRRWPLRLSALRRLRQRTLPRLLSCPDGFTCNFTLLFLSLMRTQVSSGPPEPRPSRSSCRPLAARRTCPAYGGEPLGRDQPTLRPGQWAPAKSIPAMGTQKLPCLCTNFTPTQITPVFWGTCRLILEWLGIGWLQCLYCGDAPFGEVRTEVMPTPPRLLTWPAWH